MAVLNLDASEPYITPTTSAESSALFPNAPIYARAPAKKTSSNLPLMIGLPVLAIAAGGLAWGLMGHQTPVTDGAVPTQVADASPPPTQPAAPMPTPAPMPATPVDTAAPVAAAPVQVARAETAAPPRVTTPAKRSVPARHAAPETAPDAGSASENVSATVPAAPTPPPVIAAPAAPPAPVASAPAPAPIAPVPASPVTPDAPM